MEQLPLELIENILSNETLSVQDVVNFSSTSSYFCSLISSSSEIWKQKYYHTWPKLTHFFGKEFNNYLDEIKYVYKLKHRTVTLLESMSPRFYKKYQLSDTDLEEWAELASEKPQNYDYIVAHLRQIITITESIKSISVVPLNTPGNLTLQYYAHKVLRFLKQQHLTKVWNEYIHLPPKKQILEGGATLVAQWCQPELDLTEDKIESHLNFIADMVKDKLVMVNPHHQIFKTAEEDLQRWKTENLDKNQWSLSECRQVIVTIREVMYGDLGFGGNSENYYIPQNSLVNKVLETRKGLPIILAIIYASIGRRLGLLLEPINFPAHFLLRFVEGEGKNQAVYYIDTFNGGNVMQKMACPYSAPVPREVLFPVATAAQVVERIVNNLELSTRQHVEINGRIPYLRSILELLVMVNPSDLSAVVSLAKLYSLYRINTKSLEQYLLSQSYDTPEQIESILATVRGLCRHHDDGEIKLREVRVPRTVDVRYAVGMIVTDCRCNEQCVIYAWNLGQPSERPEHLSAPVPTYRIANKLPQPWYNVLVEDGSYRYLPQEQVVPSSDMGVLHLNKNIGRHFSHFFENHFVPNSELETEYPFDSTIRHRFYLEMKLSHYQP